MCNDLIPDPQLDPARRLKRPTCVVNFFAELLQVSAVCERSVQFDASVNNDGNIQIVGVHWEPVDLHRLAVYLTSS